jgi:hypothetical protein
LVWFVRFCIWQVNEIRYRPSDGGATVDTVSPPSRPPLIRMPGGRLFCRGPKVKP